MNQELYNQISSLNIGENVVVTVNPEIRDAMALLVFQEQSLEMELQSVRENRYGFYSREHVIDILAKMEDKRVERVEFIDNVARQLLGDDYRAILDQFGVEFQIDTALPVIVFFKCMVA